MDTTTKNDPRTSQRSLSSRLLVATCALVLCFAVPSTNSGGDGGWAPLPALAVLAVLVPPPAPTTAPSTTSTSTSSSNLLVVTQSMQSDVKLQLPTKLYGATAYVSTSTGANSIMPTVDGQWVMPASQTSAFAAAGITTLYVAFVSPAGSMLVTISIDAANDLVTVKV